MIRDSTGHTTVPGIWVAGNVANPRAQVITAAGEGSAAAIAINADLSIPQRPGRTSEEDPLQHPPTPGPGQPDVEAAAQQRYRPESERREQHHPGSLVPIAWGAAWGILQAVSPFGLWWLPASTVYAVGLIIIASIYIGFAVADGRPKVIAVESAVALAFVIVASLGITGSAWILVAGLFAHGLKDLWQHRTHFVDNTRWWPLYCAAVDFVAAAMIAAALIAGIEFSHP